jgi:hypothetical protein
MARAPSHSSRPLLLRSIAAVREYHRGDRAVIIAGAAVAVACRPCAGFAGSGWMRSLAAVALAAATTSATWLGMGALAGGLVAVRLTT